MSKQECNRLIAIGDIHGCYYTLANLLQSLNYSASSDILIFVGDYIDRGMHSLEVISTLRHLERAAGSDRVICLRGNHEQMAIDAYESGDNSLWYQNGGYRTDLNFERNRVGLSYAINWFKTLPVCVEAMDMFFCHAGFNHPNKSDNSVDDLLWSRSWIVTDDRPREKTVIFGHTPSPTGAPYYTKSGDLCIDGGCVFGRNLCAAIFEENKQPYCLTVPKSQKDSEF